MRACAPSTARWSRFSPDLIDAAVVSGPATDTPIVAVDDAAQGPVAAYVLVPDGDGYHLALAEADGASDGADLTRTIRSLPAGVPVLPVPDQSRRLTRDDLDAWAALGLALTSADLVGLMRGVLDVSVAYARERKQYGVAIGTFQAVQHLLAEARCLIGGGVQRRAVSRVGRGSARARRGPRRRARAPRPTARAPHAPSARPRCRCTAGSETRGTASSTSISAGRCSPRSGSGTTASSCASSSGSVSGCRMDFRDSPAEAEFRSRLRAWIAEHNPGLPVSSTDDEYWDRQAEWHTALYDAGFFGLSWPSRFGGHDLPSVFDVILDEELAAAGAPPRPSLGYLVQGITTHASEAVQQRFLPGLISGRERWCQGFQRARRRVRPGVRCAPPRRATATTT